MASEGLHEPADKISPATQDLHRAIVSLMEELEAVDWYGQRVDAVGDVELRAILSHNRDEEQEHAAMVLEWIRRHDAGFDRHLRTYLFKSGSIVARESTVSGGGDAAASGQDATNGTRPQVSVGSLRGNR